MKDISIHINVTTDAFRECDKTLSTCASMDVDLFVQDNTKRMMDTETVMVKMIANELRGKAHII